jgi:hypothetical protein
MGSQRLHNIALEAQFCCQIYRLEVPNILGLEEHQPYDSLTLINFEWVSSQYDSLHYDLECIASLNLSSAHHIS